MADLAPGSDFLINLVARELHEITASLFEKGLYNQADLSIGVVTHDRALLDGLARSRRDPVVDGEHDVAACDEHLVEVCVVREGVLPGVVDGRRARSSVDVDDRRVPPGRIEVVRLDDARREREPVARGNREDLRRLKVKGREALRAGGDQNRALHTAGVVQRERGRRVLSGVVVQVEAPIRREDHPVRAFLPSDPPHSGAVEPDAVQVPLDRGLLESGEVDDASRLVDERGSERRAVERPRTPHRPVSPRDPVQEPSVGAVPIQMCVAVALG